MSEHLVPRDNQNRPLSMANHRGSRVELFRHQVLLEASESVQLVDLHGARRLRDEIKQNSSPSKKRKRTERDSTSQTVDIMRRG
jgi:hypothetical protein